MTRNELLESVIPFIRSVVKGDDDLFQDACVLMLKYLHKYDPKQGKLTTFTSTVIRSVFRKKMYYGVKLPERHVENPPVLLPFPEDIVAPKQYNIDFDVLDPFEEYLILEHYYNNTSQRELARLSDMSTSQVNKTIKSALGKLKDAYFE